jgi:hypothetical protein
MFDAGLPKSIFSDVKGRTFIYPSAGDDFEEPFRLFSGHCDELIFVDINYDFDCRPSPAFDGWRLVKVDIFGSTKERIRIIEGERRSYREVSPAWRRQIYRCEVGSREVVVTQRRGFGQYAIRELPDESLGIFFHRGDSGGEGGSGVLYLGNQTLKHEPIARVFDTIKTKLSYPALIASDGSNIMFPKIRRAVSDGNFSLNGFSAGGLRWTQVAKLPWRLGATVIWKVQPIAAETWQPC